MNTQEPNLPTAPAKPAFDQDFGSQLKRLLRILQNKAETTQEFLNMALDEALQLTQSKFGYIYHYHEDRKVFIQNKWPKEVMQDRSLVDQQTCFELDKTGVWGEAVRQRKPIIINNFEHDDQIKKGFPNDHNELLKYMSIPVFSGDQIVGVVGVANKTTDYATDDVLQLQLLMDAVWKVVEMKETLNREQHLKKILLGVRNVNQLITKENDPQVLINAACDNLTETMGYFNAWIVLLDENKKITMSAASGFEKDFDVLLMQMENGNYPQCMNQVLEYNELAITENPDQYCTGCAISKDYEGRSGLCYALKFAGKTYGIISVSAPAEFAHDNEEHDLFIELATDLGFALHKIEIERSNLKIEKRLRESEEKFRLIAENTADCIAVMDMNLRITYVSPSVYQLRGFTVEEAIQQSIEEIFLPESLEKISELYEVSLSRITLGRENTESTVTIEVEEYHKNGTAIWAEISFSFIYDENNNPIGIVSVTRDISHRKKIEAQVAEKQREMSTLIANLPGMVYRCKFDRDYTMLFMSDGCKILTGYDPDEFIGNKSLSFNQIIQPKKQEELWNRWQNVISQRGVFEEEYEIRAKNGEIRWVWERGQGVFDENGDCIFLEGFINDITSWKKAEDSLKTSNRIFNHSLDMLCIAGFDGYFKVLNPAWSRTLGYSTEELLAKPWNDFVHPDDIESTNSIKSKIIDGQEVYQFENRYICMDGTVKWLAWNSFSYPDENIMFGVARDITERKKIEEELETNKNRLFSLFNVLPTGIGLVQDRMIKEVNPRMCEMTGYKSEELVGKSARMLYLTDEDYEYVGRIKYDMIEKLGTGSVETRWKCKDGSIINILLASTPIDSNDRSKGVTFTATDISEQKKLTETLRKSEHTLQKIFETLPVGLWFADKEGTLISGNEAGIKIWGAEPKVSPKDYGVFKARRLPSGEEITPESWALVQTVKEGKTILNELLEIDALDGVKRIILNSTAPIIDNDGSMMGAIIVNQDITEKTRAEMELRLQEQKFRSMILNSKDIISMYAANGTILYKSPGLKNILGYDPNEVNGRNIMELLHPDDVQNVGEAFKNLVKLPTCESVHLNIRAVHKDGSVRWLDATLTNMLDDPGVRAIIGNYKNITDRVQTEMISKIQYNIAHAMVTAKNLNDLFEVVRNELSNLLDTTNFIIAQYDAKNDLLTAPFERDEQTKTPPTWPSKNSISGLVIRKKASLLLRKKDILQLAAEGKIVLRGSRAESWLGVPMMINKRPIGLMILQSYTNPEAYNNSSQKILEIIANQLSIYIEQKNSEFLAQKLSKAIIQSPVSIVITDPNGSIEYVNPRFTELTGFTLEEAIGENPKILKSGEHNDLFYKNLWETIKSGKDWSGEFRNKKKNGELYWESANISPLVNEDGVITNFVAVKEDITERKKMVEDLIVAKDQAEASDRLKTAFMNNISHEIRTPLSGINGFGQLITQPNLTEEEIESYMDILEKSTERLINTINDYMDASLIASNNLKPVITPFEMNQFLSDVFGNFERQCKEKSLELTLIAPNGHENLEITTDKDLLRKVFHHLLGNSVKFTTSGKISFGYALKAKTIDFWVKDTGIGIKPEAIEKMLNAFNQEENSSTRKYQGSGLGLTISKGIISNLGGKLWVSSEKGAGTTINFTLPVKSALAKSPEVLPAEIRGLVIEDPLLLIAEDEESNFLYLKALLKKSPVKILRAYNGQEAVDFCRKHPDISLVLMDIKMPIMDGIEATKEIKAFRKNLPIIAVTAHALTGDEHRIREAGCDDYISKPLKKEVLWSKLTMAGIKLEV